MSKFERFDPSNVTPAEAEPGFEDPKLQEALEQESDAEAAEDGFENEYRERLAHWRAAKAEYSTTKAAYEERLAEYYRNYSDKSIFGRGGQRLSEWWNGKPEDLTNLEAEYKAARSTYAEGLQDVLVARGDSNEQNVDFDAGAERTRTAFAERFVLEPKRDQMEVEKEHLHSTETVVHAERILQVLKKHKWTVRVGSVTAAGIIVGSGAGVAAGVAAGGVKAGRIALGALGGSIGAKIGDRIGREGVEDARANLAEAETNAVERFTVADIDTLEAALTNAQNTVDSKERARKYKIIAGALIGGGSMANLDSLGGAMVSEAHASIPRDQFEWTDQDATELGREHAELDRSQFEWTDPAVIEPRIDSPDATAADAEAEEIAAEAMRVLEETRAETIATEARDESLAGTIDAEVNDALAAQADAETLAAETMEVLRDTTPVSDYEIEKGDVLWNITKDSYAPRLEGLSEAQQNQVLAGVFEHLRQDPSLTAELGVESGNVDLIYENDVLKMSAISDLVNEQIDRIGAPVPEGAVEVSSGDTLWTLTQEAYSEKLDGLSEAQQNRVLDGVFDAVRRDPQLIEDLGVRSGNIDLIRPNEVMHLDRLSELVDREVERVTANVETAPEPTDATRTEAVDPAPVTDARIETETAEAVETRVVTDAERTAAATELGVSNPVAESVLARFATIEAFREAKLAAIEDIVGEQAASWGGGERFNPVFERIKTLELSALSDAGIDRMPRLEGPAMDQFLESHRMDLTESNRVDLQTWHGFYRDIIRPDRLGELGITITPGMTFDELFTLYVLRTTES